MHLGRVPAAPVGMLSDLAVMQQHRTAGPALKILRAVTKAGLDGNHQLLFGWPNSKSAPIFKRLRFKQIATSRDWVKLLHADSKVRARVGFGPLAKLVAVACDAGLRLYDRSARPAAPGYRTAVTCDADDSFDALWRRAPTLLITGEKTAATLNWRYARCPTRDFSFFRLYDEGAPGRLLGFVVFDDKGSYVDGVDIYCDLERDSELLLYAFSEHMRRLSVPSIRFCCAGNDHFDRALHAQHFVRRVRPRPLFVRFGEDAPAALRTWAEDEQSWFMLEGDLDV